MKKTIALILALLLPLCSVCAMAKEYDFSSYKDDALIELFEQVWQELSNRQLDVSDIIAAENTASSTIDSNSITESVIMQKGSKGDDVKTLQEYLIALGYLSGSADGSFGDKTTVAVKKYQKANGLSEDGMVTQSLFDAIQQSYTELPEKPKSYTAVELYNMFDQNKVSAEAELDGKTIIVSGKVYGIDSSIWGDYYIKLYADQWGFSGVYCYFDDDMVSEISKIRKDQKITVKGISNGCDMFGDPEIKECEIID